MSFNTPAAFKELYRTYTDEQLHEIVTTEENYQTAAVEAAREILQERGISYTENKVQPQPGAEDIKREIAERIAAGESVESVMLHLRERGLSSLDFLPEMAEEDNKKYGKVRQERREKRAKGAAIIDIIRTIAGI